VSLRSRPLFTQRFDDVGDFSPDDGATYLYGVTSEPRSELALGLQALGRRTQFVELREADEFWFDAGTATTGRVRCRNRDDIQAFLASLSSRSIYLDITGLSHSTWIPVLRVALEDRYAVRVVYLEPHSYALSRTPKPGDLYDLSERIEGIRPLPLFTTLEDPPEEDVCFVPLLGFEGARFSHMFEELQPPERKTVPVIGVPGFKPEYPFNAFLGNAAILARSKGFRTVRFATSNCPFSLFYVLEDIAHRYSTDHLKLGLTGTKPHALGAVLFALHTGRRVELVYDHVRRKANRTQGVDKCLVYAVSDFLPARVASPHS
jgi:hypothetical protein